MQAILFQVGALGEWVIEMLRSLGKCTIFIATACSLMVRPPFKIRRIIDQVYFIGVKSIFVVSLTAVFTGMVLGLQGYYTLAKFNSEGLLGGAVALSLIRELGPVLSALMVAGRAGSSMAAELGTMRISEQIDAVDTMNIHPLKFLVSPKIAASIIAVPLLTAIFNIVGVMGGYITGVVMLEVNRAVFMNSMIQATDMQDIVVGMTKPVFFGLMIAGLSSYKGYYCDILKTGRYGSESVSYATTSAVVGSSVVILVLDYVLTAILL